MPKRTEVKTVPVGFDSYLSMAPGDVETAVEKGATLVLVESLFSDPGPDYSALELDGREVARWPGY